MKKIWTILLSTFLSATLAAQTADDMALLRGADFSKATFRSRSVRYGFANRPSKWQQFNPAYHLLSGSMYVYQKYISPQLATECAFSPSCSAYSKLLIGEFGVVKGIFCSADRLTRCNRIALSGIPRGYFDSHDHKLHETVQRYSR